jgi:hypothetical protein
MKKITLLFIAALIMAVNLYAKNIARLFNETGLLQISFDGLEVVTAARLFKGHIEDSEIIRWTRLSDGLLKNRNYLPVFIQ